MGVNAPPSTLRLVISTPVAALALVAAPQGVSSIVPPGEIFALLRIWLALALLLAWLLAPAPWGGGTSPRALLSPDPARPLWVGVVVALAGAAMVGVPTTMLGYIAAPFDLDRKFAGYAERPATAAELLGEFALMLGIAAFHGLYALGWVMGPYLRAGRDGHGCIATCGVTVGYQTLAFAMAGMPGYGFAISMLVLCPLTLLMALPLLLGGRVWPVILASAGTAALPMVVLGVRDYPM